MEQQLDIQKIGRFIQQQRIAQNLTQKQLGGLVGVTDKAVSKWERGLSLPDIALLSPLAGVFGITEGELINGERTRLSEMDAEAMNKVVDKTVEYSSKSYGSKAKMIFMAFYAGLAILTVATCVIVNLAVNRTVSWAWYPIGGLAVGFALVYPLLYAPRLKLEATLLSFGVATLAYLFLIQLLSGTGGWAAGLGLPIMLVSLVLAYVVAKAFTKLRNKFYSCSVLFLAIGAGLLVINGIIGWYGIPSAGNLGNTIGAAGCIAVSLLLLLLGKLRKK